MDGPDPVITSSDDRTRSWLVLAGGLVITVGLVLGVIALWPSGDDEVSADGRDGGAGWVITTTTEATGTTAGQGSGEPSRTTTTAGGPVATTEPASPRDLFDGGFEQAFADLLREAGSPTQLIEVSVYDTYAFMAYRDPAAPANVDRRQWRDGHVGAAEPNTGDDRVDADTEPSLFAPGELDPAVIARVAADAPAHYDLPVEVTHVIIDRFLPFDERVLIRVYATPRDGRSGGGYVSYDTAGTFVEVCC